MSRLQLLNFINLAIDLILLGAAVLIGIINKFNNIMYNGFSFALATMGIVDLVFIAIKEATIDDLVVKKYNIVPHAMHVVFGVLCFYLQKYLGYYEQYNYLYWIGFVFALIVPYITYFVIDYFYTKKHDDNNGPKFIVNK